MIKIGKDTSSFSIYSYQPKNRKELKDLIDERVVKEGSRCDLNDIDVSLVTDMSYLFYASGFNGNISKWDVSNVTNMNAMFAYSDFDQDISKWKINSKCWANDIFYRCRIREEYKPKLKK